MVEFSQLKKAAVRAQGGGDEDDAEEFVWGVIEAAMSPVGDEAVAILQLVKFLREFGSEATSSDYGFTLVPNPYFVVNGHGGDSPATAKYLRHRHYKSLGGSVVSGTGAAIAIVSQVDIGGTLQHGSALGSTSAHWYKLAAIGGRYKGSRTISGWVQNCIRAKQCKTAIRTTDLAGSVIPIGWVGFGTTAATAIGKVGVKLTLDKMLARTAMELHWRARVEATLGAAFGGGSRGAQGPAGAVIHEIFTRRGATRIFGKYDTDAIIREPAGWMAVSDKLNLM